MELNHKWEHKTPARLLSSKLVGRSARLAAQNNVKNRQNPSNAPSYPVTIPKSIISSNTDGFELFTCNVNF